MKNLHVDFDEIQMAMEDISRDAFDYFLDRETGDVLILSEEIISLAIALVEEHFDEDLTDYEEVVFDEDYDIPDWMEDEVDLALEIFLDKHDRYVRIPERSSQKGFAAMKMFTETMQDGGLKQRLRDVLNGEKVFRRFKDELEPYPKERKSWYGFNAKRARQEILEWLSTLGVAALTREKGSGDSE